MRNPPRRVPIKKNGALSAVQWVSTRSPYGFFSPGRRRVNQVDCWAPRVTTNRSIESQSSQHVRIIKSRLTENWPIKLLAHFKPIGRKLLAHGLLQLDSGHWQRIRHADLDAVVWTAVPALDLLSVEQAQILSANAKDTGTTWISHFGHGSLADAQGRCFGCCDVCCVGRE